ncbi:MAG TPA: TIGR00725 family protein [Acidimicrobiales bacterium]|nr:TIGR00725 family protein [Acidimicrobiales bacterium]
MGGLATPARHVAVIGGYEAGPDVLALAEEAGRLLAQQGCVVVTGGRGGVAEAASRGAVLAGGTTVGILPGTVRSEANPYVTIAVPTGLGDTRNALVVMDADAVIALPGAYGTLSEIAHALLAGARVVALGDGWNIPGTVPATTAAQAVQAALPG